MDTMILQVPISKTLKKQAEAVAREHGFSSLQESVRIFLKKLADRTITIDIGVKEDYMDNAAFDETITLPRVSLTEHKRRHGA